MTQRNQRGKLRHSDIRGGGQSDEGQPKNGLPLGWRQETPGGADRPQDVPRA